MVERKVDVGFACFARTDFRRIFFLHITQFQNLFVTKQAIVVKAEFCVQCDQLAIGGQHQRIDLYQAAVERDKQLAE